MNFTFRPKRISGLLGRDEFDALLLVTQSPDHFMPPTSSIIQGRLNLKHDPFCLDINQGCAICGHLHSSAYSAYFAVETSIALVIFGWLWGGFGVAWTSFLLSAFLISAFPTVICVYLRHLRSPASFRVFRASQEMS